jgi:hypothetical protein
VFTRSGTIWTQQGPKLTAFDADGNAKFGQSVALSGDGNTALIGGPLDQTAGGAAWVFTRSGSTWTQQGPKLIGSGADGNADEGSSVALSADGNTALIGGPTDSRAAGAAWVFTRSGSTWSQQGSKLVGSSAAGPAPRQGASVALSGDGNTALIGGPFDADNSGVGHIGAVWVFTRAGSGWSQAGSKLTQAGAAYFGQSVALSADGNTALIGSPADNNFVGAAYVFVPYNAARTLWIRQGRLVASNVDGAQGSSVALSGNGNTAAVGASEDNNLVGAMSVFTRSPATPVSPPTWSQQGSKLVGSGAAGNARQGTSVALSADGSTAVIGGPTDNNSVGAVWMFTSGLGATPPRRPKLHLAIDGPRVVTAGRIARYRIAVRLARLHNGRVSRLRNVHVVSKHAGRRIGRWRIATLAPGRKRILRLRVRVPAGARGSFCITTRASARAARGAIVRYCTRIAGI